MVYKRVSSALFFSIVWILLVCPKAYSQSNSMRVARIFSDNMVLQQGYMHRSGGGPIPEQQSESA